MAQERGGGTKSGSPFCEIICWRLQAYGRAYKLLTGQMRCQSIGQRSVPILGNSVLQFCFLNIEVCCYLVAIYAWNTLFWTKYFTEIDLWDILSTFLTMFGITTHLRPHAFCVDVFVLLVKLATDSKFFPYKK